MSSSESLLHIASFIMVPGENINVDISLSFRALIKPVSTRPTLINTLLDADSLEDYDDSELLDALADAIIDRQEKVVSKLSSSYLNL